MKETRTIALYSILFLSPGWSLYGMDKAQNKTEQRTHTLDGIRLENTLRLLEILRSEKTVSIETVKKLLEKPIALDYYHPGYKVTPLRATIATNQIEIAQLLFEKGASVRPPDDPLSPLGTAAAYGHTHFIALLLSRGADVLEKDTTQITPTAIAAEQKRPESLRALLNAGGDANEVRPDGNSLLTESISSSNHTVTKILLENGAHPNLEDEDEHVPLGKAVSKGNLTAMSLLREHNVDIHRKNPRGSTAFHLAAFHGRIKALQLLQEWCPEDLNVQDYIGRTPFFWAVIQGKQDMIDYLLESKIDLTVTFINGESMLDWLKREQRKIYDLIQRAQPKKGASTRKKSKKPKKNKGKTYNQRNEGKVPEVPVFPERTIEEKPPLDPLARAKELNDLLVYTDDGSRVLSDDGQTISFGYKHLNYAPTERIYCLRNNTTICGPRLIYHPSLSAQKKEFLESSLNAQIVSYCNSEVLERMSGHCIRAHYVDKRGRRIHNRLFFGKKLLGGTWVEGIFMLAFANIKGEYTCFYSGFTEKRFDVALRSFEIDPHEQALLEAVLDKIGH